MFDSVFPPGESPFLSGFVTNEQLRPEQQRLADVVNRVLQPNFSQMVAYGATYDITVTNCTPSRSMFIV